MSSFAVTPPVVCLCVLRTVDAAVPEAEPGDDWVANASQLVLAHGGSVSQASAQQLDAVFEPRSGPADQVERALRCAQALLAQAQTSTAAAQAPPLPASLRLGLHGATQGQAGSAELVGIAQQAAAIARATPPGRLCVQQALLAQVRGLFDADPALPLALPGQPSPLQACLLRDAVWQTPVPLPRSGDELDTALIGRRDELQTLQEAFRRVVRGGGASVVTVLAQAGIGKSRLLREFDRWAQAQPVNFHRLHGQASPQTASQAFGLLGQLLRGYCQIDLDSPVALARLQLEAALAPWFEQDEGAELAQGHAHLLGHLMGIALADSRHLQGLLSDPTRLRQRVVTLLGPWLRRLSAAGGAPLLLLIEDLHWADSESMACLDLLLKADPDLALLIVASSRPALADHCPAWTRDEGLVRCLDLGPLDPLRSRELAADLLKNLADIPRALLDLVVADSAGQAYAIEERIKLLIDQGVVVASGHKWAVNRARLRLASLPARLDQVLKARLDLLPAAQRRTLQGASVIGLAFGAEALSSLGRGLSQAMPALLQRELALSAAPGAQGSAPAFNFKHQLLQELVYGSLAPRARRALHARFANWLAALTGLRANEVPGQSAHHFEQAGDLARAAEQHARAAEHAQLRYAADAVMTHVQRGLTLLDRLPARPDQPALRWRLLKARIRVMEVIGQRAQHRVDLDALVALAEAMDDDGRRADASMSCTLYALFTADFAGLKAAARQTMDWAARAGDHALRLQAMINFASAHFHLGDWDAGQRLARQCLAEARERGVREVEAYSTNLLGIIASRQRDPVAGLHWDEQTLAIWRELGDRSHEAISVCNIGESWLELGEPTLARRHLEEGARLSRRCGHLVAHSAALSNLSMLERRMGQGEQALALARLAIDAAVATTAPAYEAIGLQQLGETELLLGHFAAATQAFRATQALALRHQHPPPPDALGGLAAVALAEGDVATALQQVLQVLALDAAGAVAVGSLNPRRLALICHRVLANADDPRALAWLQRAHGELLDVAATISDEALRDGFFNNIPDHRAILAAWAMHAPGPG